jgi:hypothetical protein
MLCMLVQYNAVPVYIYGVTGSFRLSFYMLIYKAPIFILSVCVDDKYTVYIYILTSGLVKFAMQRAILYVVFVVVPVGT